MRPWSTKISRMGNAMPHHDSSPHGCVTVQRVFPVAPGTLSRTSSYALRRRRLSPECVCPCKPDTFRNRASIIGSVWMDYSAVLLACQHIFLILCELSVKLEMLSTRIRYFAEGFTEKYMTSHSFFCLTEKLLPFTIIKDNFERLGGFRLFERYKYLFRCFSSYIPFFIYDTQILCPFMDGRFFGYRGVLFCASRLNFVRTYLKKPKQEV